MPSHWSAFENGYRIWLFAGLFIFLHKMPAQQFLISGQVADSSENRPLIGASVFLPELGKGTYTDEEGKFSLEFTRPASPTVSLQIAYTGYLRQEIILDIQGKNTYTQTIYLRREDLKTDEVVITASKGFEQRQSDVTVSLEVVKQEAINLLASSDITRALNQVPGVEEADGQVSIRGSSGYAYGVGSRVMVMLNGLPLLTGDAGIADLRTIPTDNISQIEVMKGASSVLYGSSALGGVINVITSDAPVKPYTSIRFHQTVYDRPANKALDWDGPSAAWATNLHAFHSRRIGALGVTLQADLIRESGYRQGTSRREMRGIAMLNYRPKKIPGLTVGLNITTRIDSSGTMLYWRGYHPDTTLAISGMDTSLFVTGGGLTPTQEEGGYRRRIATRLSLDPTIKYLTDNGNLFWYRGRYLRNAAENNTNQSSDNSIFYNDFLFQTTLFGNINWVIGATYTWSRANSQGLFGNTEGDTVISDGIFDGHSLGAYTQLDAKFGRLNLSLGFRYETVKIDTLPRESRPIFRAGINYKIAEGTNVRASIGQAFRVPTVAERFTNTAGGAILVEPNPNIGSEYGFSAELGIRQGFIAGTPDRYIRGYVDLAGFMMQYRDMVEFGYQSLRLFDTVNGVPILNPRAVFTSVNIADARILGAELTTQLDWRAKKWFGGISGGVTFIDPQNLNSVPEEQQIDLSEYPDGEWLNQLLNPNLSDQPPVLKYRSRMMVRGSITLGVGRVALTTNLRYRSFQESIDQYLYLIVPDLNEFRQKYPNGEMLTDLILTYRVTDNFTMTFNTANIFNVEYAVIPGFLGEQRKFTLQAQVTF